MVAQARVNLADLSLAERLSLLPEAEQKRYIAELAPTREDEERLAHSWEFWGRPKQHPPPGKWRNWLLMSGRGFGKTRTMAEWIISCAYEPDGPLAIVGQTKADARDTMIEVGPSSILKISPPWFMPTYEPSKRRLTWPNGAIATVFSGDEPDQLRGPQFWRAWIDELCKMAYAQETYDNLQLGLRIGASPRVGISTTPRPIPVLKEVMNDPRTVLVKGTTYENIGNLSEEYIDHVVRRYEDTTLGKQELYGMLMGDVEGALWTRNLIEKTRVRRKPEQLARVVVGVDPKASKSAVYSKTGIVAAGATMDNHGYILEDASVGGGPQQWGRKVIACYEYWGADAIVVEINQGGDMVAEIIRGIDQNVRIIEVRATRGKATRAEPVVQLYEQNRLHHVGMHADLEDQMCSWIPGDDSPDNLDAMVWSVNGLRLRPGRQISVGAY